MEIRLRDFSPRSALIVPENIPAKARFKAIDINNHFGRRQDWIFQIQMPYPDAGWTIPDIPKSLALMDEMNIDCAVNLDGGWGDAMQKNLERYKVSYPDRFIVFGWIDWSKIDEPNFGEKWAKELERSVGAGASGL